MLSEQYAKLQTTFTDASKNVWKQYDDQLTEAIQNSRSSVNCIFLITAGLKESAQQASVNDIRMYQTAQTKLKELQTAIVTVIQTPLIYNRTLDFLYANYEEKTVQTMTTVKEFCQNLAIDLARSIAIYEHELNRIIVKANLPIGNYYNRLIPIDISDVHNELNDIINGIKIDPLTLTKEVYRKTIELAGNQAQFIFEDKRKEFVRYLDHFQESIDKQLANFNSLLIGSFLGRISKGIHEILTASLIIKNNFKAKFTKEMTAIAPYPKPHVLKCMEDFVKRQLQELHELSNKVLTEKIIFKYGLACGWYTLYN